MDGVKLCISNDEMSATLTIVARAASETVNLSDLIHFINKQGLVFGLLHKRLDSLLEKSKGLEPNSEISDIIAEGLSPAQGANSYVKPLSPNTYDQFVSLNVSKDQINDFNTLLDQTPIAINDIVAKHIPPTFGKAGKSVTGRIIPGVKGDIIKPILGQNTRFSTADENLIVSTIAGQAKNKNGITSVVKIIDFAYLNSLDNNLKYDGTVFVDGDVVGNVKIAASGDVIVKGFVESSKIEAEGDIIITEGATGQIDNDCQIIAKGNIFLPHANGLYIEAGEDLTLSKQLAYSEVRLKGKLTVGMSNKPMGNLFANTIYSSKGIYAGSIGAISGSKMVIDFSEEYESLYSRFNTIVELQSKCSNNNARHETTLKELFGQIIPENILEKLLILNDEIESERNLLKWLSDAQLNLKEQLNTYENSTQIIANKELFPGVTVILKTKIWQSEKEYQECKISLNSGIWQNTPI